MNKGVKLASDIKYYSGYSQYIEKESRKETWKESVARVMRMHKHKFKELYEINPEFKELLDFAQQKYEDKHVLASQRSLQWAAEPILKHNSRMFNCLTLYADRPAFFQEVMYWLLSGCGVGFSVQKKHIKSIPQIQRREGGVKTFVISDDIEGWSDSIGVLISSYLVGGGTFKEYEGFRVDFDYSRIRPNGAKITGGFRAPGPDGLREAHLKIEKLLDDYLRDKEIPTDFKSILIYDIVMHSSDAVLSGGVRRCLPETYLVKTSPDSYKQIKDCKVGDNIYYNGTYYPITNTFDQGNQELVRITTTEGFHVSTKNHKWLVYNKELKEAEWKTPEEIVKNVKNYAFLREKVNLENFEMIDILAISDYGDGQTYDIEVEDVHLFTAKNPETGLESISHNSATISLFSIDDNDMLNAKTGNWFITNPQRARSNNSVVLLRGKVDRQCFAEIMKSVKEFGEPGFIWSDDEDIAYNPCCEIGMVPKYQIKTQEEAKEYGVKIGDWVSGAQGCNLTEINGRLMEDEETFYEACKASAIIGTLQASYTDFKYVGSVTKKIFDKEALLGASITGWMNNPEVLFNEKILKKGVQILKEVNEKVAAMIGINPAARLSTTKPSGNSSIILGTASGIHGEHAPRYFRNIQLNKTEDISKHLLHYNPEVFEESVWSASNTDWVVSIPIETPKGSMYKDELYGIKQLEYVKKAQKWWVEPGTVLERCTIPEVRHNISNTILVDDWDGVEQYIFDNQKHFAGISLLSTNGDRDYAQAPFTTVYTTREIVRMYGDAALYASGLIVDGLDTFDNNLWAACDTVLGIGMKLTYTKEEVQREMDEKSVEELWKSLETRPKVLRTLIKSEEKPDLIDYKEYMDRRLCTNVFKAAEKVEWVRRAKRFADKFFKSDYKTMTYCLKDVYNNHKWNKIERNITDVEWEKLDFKPTYIEINTTGAQSCYGNGCEI